MLYSEKKERSNRFKLALKVAFPFTLVLIFVAYFMFKEGDFTRDDVILFVILLLCYVYYATYLIYMGFKKSLIDPVSRVFVRDEILKIIAKDIKKEKVNNIVLMRIKNIIDINDRYGYRNGDEILRLFVVEFDKFMQDHKFKDIPIGRFINGNFIFAIDGKRANLHHILNMFERKIANQTINNIELKMEYATINADYDKNLNNVINALFYKINHKDDEELDFDKIEIGTFENDVLEAINNEQYSIKYQLMKSVNGEDEYLNFIPKIDLKEQGKITKSKIIDIILQNNYAVKYDLNLIKYIAKNIYFRDIKGKIFVEIIASTLRNSDFKKEILKLIDNNLIDPKKIVFEFNEELIYPEIKRFSEILLQFKELGFSFGLSQFGGANASFEYLKHLNVDFVIYDIEFNKNFYEEKTHEIFLNLNKMCKEIGVKTAIRFVDKKPFYEDLKESGIDIVQGFCIEKPVDLENLREQI